MKVNNGKTERVPVKKGREMDGKIEIYGTLNVGDILLTKANEEVTTARKLPKNKPARGKVC